jgi:acetyl-CoA carboxylase biotin carboxyl carrier protein
MDDALLIEIQHLCRLAHERGLQELSITQPGFSISLSTVATAVAPASVAPVAGVAMPIPASFAPVVPPPPVVEAPKGHTIASPLVGIFYRTPSPDSPTFVEIGDTVEVGETIGIVEAMKVFNEITADCAGTVIAIPAENGKLVQVDQPLVVIDPIA